MRAKEAFIFFGATLAIVEASKFAFSKEVRKKIGERDSWSCRGNGHPCTLGTNGGPASFNDGFMVEAAHLDHNKDSIQYNNPDNGVCMCRLHHAMSHWENGEMWEAEQILSRGVYTYKHANQYGQIYITIDELEEIYVRESQMLLT